jgi:nucleotide-binding universal stress UspA family protein
MRLLVGYDGTHAAREALALAKKRAMLLGATVDVVNCMVQNPKLKYEDIRKAEEKLEDEARSVLNSEKIPYDTHLVVSGPDIGEGLVQYAEQHNADEIFIGIRKRSKVGKLVFGSTAQFVILNAPCPVVVAK